MITPMQMRAARAMLDLSQGEVAAYLGIAANTLSNIEAGKSDVPASRLKDIQDYYEGHGLDFTQDEGVKRKSSDVIVYKGHEGFTQFRSDVLAMAKKGSLDICVSNVDERNFSRWGGTEMNAQYREEMSKIDDVTCRIIVKKGDMNFVASGFAEYRWADETDFGDIPFYIFGDKTAIIPFSENELHIFIIHHSLITKFYRQQFESNWSKAIPVEKS